MLSLILSHILSPEATEFMGSYLADFIDSRETANQILILRQIPTECCEYQVKATYDKTIRTELWKI